MCIVKIEIIFKCSIHLDAIYCNQVTVVLLVDNHLWREIVQGSTKCVTSRGRRVHCPAKVRNFQRVFQADQDVLRLDVSVNDVFRMTVLDTLTRGTVLLPLHNSESKRSKQRSLLEQLVPPPSA